MTGTIINVATVLLGGTLGLSFSPRRKARFRETVIIALALFTLAVGAGVFIGIASYFYPVLSFSGRGKRNRSGVGARPAYGGRKPSP